MTALAWQWQPLAVALLGAFAVTGGLGWTRLRRRRRVSAWRLAAYLAGFVALAVALLSPVHSLGDRLFSAHMLGHDLLLLVAAPLLMLADPIPFLVSALPGRRRRALRRRLASGTRLRRVVEHATAPRMAWLFYLGALGLWHSAGAYRLAVRYDLIRWLEHLMLLGSALLFWWHLVGAAPRIHGRLGYGARIGLVLSAYILNQVIGVTLVLSGTAFYPTDPQVLQAFGITAVQDQTFGGGVMWVPGEIVYAGTIFVLVMQLVDEEEPVRGVAELYPRDSTESESDGEI